MPYSSNGENDCGAVTVWRKTVGWIVSLADGTAVGTLSS